MKAVLLIFLLLGCSAVEKTQQIPLSQTENIELVLMHTNDHHGHYLKDSKGQIGMAARKTLVDSIREKARKRGAYTLLLSGGDINTGTMESDIYDAEPDFKGMRKIKYDAMAVGNHEFDNSYATILKQKQWGRFPFLSANIYWKNTSDRVFTNPLYLIKNFDGIKIGIFGLTTTDTPFKASSKEARERFDFKSPIEEAKKLIKILKQKEKVDFIIAVTHMGHDGSETSQGDFEMAEKTEGIDIIVGGHSQVIINAVKIKNTLVVQAKEWGKYLGKLRLNITKHQWKKLDYKLIPINLKKQVNGKYVFVDKEIKEDKEILKLMKPFKDKIEILSKKVLGKIDAEMSGDRTKVRTRPMAIGQFMGDAFLRITKAKVAIVNGGGLRASLNRGSVTRKDLHAVHPFNDMIVVNKFKPKDFFNYIKEVSKNLRVQEVGVIGGYPHFVGMKLHFNKKDRLVKIVDRDARWFVKFERGKVRSNIESIELAISSFLANGGDNYPSLTEKKGFLNTGFTINAALEKLLKEKSPLNIRKYQFKANTSIIRLR